MKFGDNLKIIRKSRKISQEDLAEKLGVSRQSVSKWETGENYPSMNNIISLCDILKCKMNELVHENFTDINSLDEEIKMSVAKLNKEKQERVKIISNILSIFGKVTGIVVRVGIGFLIVAMIVLPIIIGNIKVKDNKITALNNKIKVTEKKNGVLFSYNDNIRFIELDKKDVSNLKHALNTYSSTKFIILTELGLVFMIAFLVLIIKLLKHLELLFKNIHDGDTPFTLENANHIKMMSYLMIACIIVSAISQTILNISFDKEDVFDFRTFNIIEIFVLYLFAYLFEYGYEIQLDSKGKIYDDNK